MFKDMTDWQMINLLANEEEEKGESQPYPELFRFAWSSWGYTDTQIEQIWQWHDVEKLSDETIQDKLRERGWLRT